MEQPEARPRRTLERRVVLRLMKKMICVVLALTLALCGLAGCKRQEVQEPESALPSASAAPAAKTQEKYRIGLVQYEEYAPLDAAREAFMSRLDEWGYGEQKLEIDYQNAGGSGDKAKEICENFVKNKTDLIVAVSAPAAKAAAEAAQGGKARLVFLGGSESLWGDMSAATGVAENQNARSVVDLALQVDPELETFGLLADPACALGTEEAQAFREYCGEKNLTVVEAQAANAGEAAQRMKELCPQVDAVFTPVDSTIAQAAADAAKEAQAAKKPWYACTEDLVQAGALAGVSTDYTEAGRKAADMAVQLAAGRELAQVPVFRYESGLASVNQAAMSALGAKLPEETLAAANYY